MKRQTAVGDVIRVGDPGEAAHLLQEAFNAGNLEGLVSMYAADAVAVPSPGEVATGPAEIRDMVKAWLAEGHLEMQVKALHRSGDLALEVIEWTLGETNAPEAPAHGLAATALSRHPDGAWRMQIDNCFILD